MLFSRLTSFIRWILVFTFTLIGTRTFSQSNVAYSVELIPATLKARANAVVRNMETVVEMRAPENVIHKVKMAVTVLNKNGDENAKLNLWYDKDVVIKSAKGSLYDADGRYISKFTLANFSDHSAVSDFSLYEDNRIKHYEPVVLSYPYTITYEYEVKFKQNLNLPEWYANSDSDLSVQQSKFVFICPPDDKIRIKEYNFKGSPLVTSTDKMTSYTWSVANLNAFKPEPFDPDPDSYLTHVKIAAEKFSYYGHIGKYNNWNDLGKWMYDELIKERQSLNAETVTRIKDLVNGINSDKEKAKKIYEFLQKKTRYISVQVGIGGYQPFSATDVDRLSYGDCKALVNYMQSLLTVVNIESYYCVVNAGSFKKNIDPTFASMDQANHIILCIPFPNDTTWLECTDQNAPYGFLGTFTEDRYVLACTPNGGKVLKTPMLSPTDNANKLHATLRLDTEGNINGQLNTIATGSQYQEYEGIATSPYTEQLKQLHSIYNVDNIKFQDLKLSPKKNIKPSITTSVSVKIEKYAPNNNGHIYLTPNMFNRSGAVPELKNRLLPVYINRGFSYEDEIIYELPQGYLIEIKPNNVDIESPFGSYSSSIVLEGQKIIYFRKIQLKNGTYPSDSYNEYAKFLNNVASYDQGKLILRTP